MNVLLIKDEAVYKSILAQFPCIPAPVAALDETLYKREKVVETYGKALDAGMVPCNDGLCFMSNPPQYNFWKYTPVNHKEIPTTEPENNAAYWQARSEKLYAESQELAKENAYLRRTIKDVGFDPTQKIIDQAKQLQRHETDMREAKKREEAAEKERKSLKDEHAKLQGRCMFLETELKELCVTKGASWDELGSWKVTRAPGSQVISPVIPPKSTPL